VGSRYIKGVWGGRPGSPISRPTPGAAPRLRHSKPMHIRGPQFSLPSPPLRPARRDLPFATLFRSHFNPGSSPPRVLPHRQSPPTRTHAPLPLCPFRPFLVPNMCSLGCRWLQTSVRVFFLRHKFKSLQGTWSVVRCGLLCGGSCGGQWQTSHGVPVRRY